MLWKYRGSLCAIWLQFPWGNDFLGVLWTEICHSPSGAHCSTNHIQTQVHTINFRSVIYYISHRRTRSIYWHGVWTIVQLMYIMAVKTSVSLLLCPTLTESGTSKITVGDNEASMHSDLLIGVFRNLHFEHGKIFLIKYYLYCADLVLRWISKMLQRLAYPSCCSGTDLSPISHTFYPSSCSCPVVWIS